MPPRGDMTMTMDEPNTSSSQHRTRSSDPDKKHRSRSSKKSSSRQKQRPQDDDTKPQHHQQQQQRRPPSRGKDDERTNRKKEHKSKNSKSSSSKDKKNKKKETTSSDNKKMSTSQQSRTPPTSNTKKRVVKNNNNVNNNNGAPPGGREEGGGVTVSQFLNKQQSMQNEASRHKNNATMRQKMMEERMGGSSKQLSQQQQQEEGETAHYFDDDESDYDDDGEKGAMVPRNNNNNNNHQQPQQQQKHQVVDTLPADHPSSSVIQTHRMCTLCQRTLPRSQFSERDRFSVSLSLAPGATCRTCSMTVCAVRLKSMPDTEQLLLEYAQRGMRQGMMALEGANNGANNPAIAGLLESAPDSLNNSDSQALIVRSTGSTGSGITGKQLTLYGGPPNSDNSNGANNNNGKIMGMDRDVNAPFSGLPYGHGDVDRPAHIADCKYIDALLQMPSYLNLNAFGLFQSSQDVSVSLAALEAVRMYGTMDEDCFRVHDVDGVPIDEQSKKHNKKRNKKKGGSAKQNETNNAARKNESTTTVNPKSIVCLVLNEGPTPRTAILASQHYGWTTISIDSNLSEDWDGFHDDVPGFTGYSGSISDFMDSHSGEYTETMIEFRKENVKHLVIIGVQKEKDSLRLKGNGHINEIRSRYEDVPTTLVGLSPVRKATLAPRRRDGECGSKLEKDIGYEPNCSYIDEGVFSTCRQVEVWNFHNAEDDDDDSEEYSEDESGYEEERYHKKESMESEDNYRHRDKEEETRRASGRRKKKSGKQKDGNNKRDWLEDRVAEFKKERPDFKKEQRNNKTRSNSGEQEQEMMASLSTLSTKETLERMDSKDGIILDADEGNPYVRNSGERQHEHQDEQPPDEIDAKPDNDDRHNEEENDHGDDSEEKENAEAWTPPDEEVANQVWEKAMAKHGEQESLCNQFEEYYDDKGNSDDNKNNHVQDHQDQDHQDQVHQDENHQDQVHQEDDNDFSQGEDSQEEHGLPPGWEAIYDQSSGDYYYNNWETGEVTWNHPLGANSLVSQQSELSSVASQLEDGGMVEGGIDHPRNDGPEQHPDDDGHIDDRSIDPKPDVHYEEKPSATTTAAAMASTDDQEQDNQEKNDIAPPLVQYNIYRQNSDDNSENESSNYLFDDHSSTSSGIAALSGYSKPISIRPLGKSLEKDESPDDDMIVWSDDEQQEEDDKFDSRPTIERSESNASQRQQPWHKKDTTENNNDSFIYD